MTKLIQLVTPWDLHTTLNKPRVWEEHYIINRNITPNNVYDSPLEFDLSFLNEFLLLDELPNSYLLRLVIVCPLMHASTHRLLYIFYAPGYCWAVNKNMSDIITLNNTTTVLGEGVFARKDHGYHSNDPKAYFEILHTAAYKFDKLYVTYNEYVDNRISKCVLKAYALEQRPII